MVTVALLCLLPILAACSGNDEPSAPPPRTAAASQTSGSTLATPAVDLAVASPSGSPSPVAAATPVGSPAPTATPIPPIALTPGPEVTAQQILRFSAGRMAGIRSAHFKATVEGAAYIDTDRSIQLVSAEGNIIRPDRAQVQFRIRIGDQAISSIRMISVGEDAWMTDIVSGDWVPALAEFDYDVPTIFDPAQGLAAVMLGVADPVRLPDDELDGRDVYVIDAAGDRDLIGPVTAYTLLGYPVAVRAWIDQETGDLLKIVLVEPPSPENSDPSTWTLELSRYDADFAIEPPDAEA